MMKKELIIAGYASQHAALLARTALSRQQHELSMSAKDIAVVSRENNGHVTIFESISLGKGSRIDASFWKTLAELLFAETDCGAKQPTGQNQLESIGIHPPLAERICSALPKGGGAILLMIDKDFRSEASAILSACQGTVIRVQLDADYFEFFRTEPQNTLSQRLP
jgi:uncharacterized membrane protein